jgi:hypothetical protein
MSHQHVETSLDKIRAIFEEAAEIIDNLKPGERVPATKLAEQLADKHDMTGPQLYPTLLFLIKDYPGVEVKRGAHGGIYRPLPKVEKKVDKSAETETNTDKTE